MKGAERNINGKKQQPGENTWSGTDMLLKPEDSVIFSRIGDYFRGYQDIEDVKSDPGFMIIKNSVAETIEGADSEASRYKAYAEYIRDSLNVKSEEDKLEEEMNEIRVESSKKDIDKIAAGWVKEWQQKESKGTATDSPTHERKEYIIKVLGEKDNVSDSGATTNGVVRKSMFLRIAIPAAAAVVGGLILVKSLLPSHDTDRLFTKYYEPINAVSQVTRDPGNQAAQSYITAIADYNSHNYQAAATGFANLVQNDPQNIYAQFLMGISQMALMNFNDAEMILEGVVASGEEYMKEARWYLGLTYLKTGHPEKAAACFDILAKTPGFYSKRAEDILRRLR